MRVTKQKIIRLDPDPTFAWIHNIWLDLDPYRFA